MKYEFRFYKEEYYDAMIELARKSYAWEVPAVPVSRVEFANTINKEFNDSHSAWEKTIGCYFENDKLVACTWNEACYDGENMLMFDSKERNVVFDYIKKYINKKYNSFEKYIN